MFNVGHLILVVLGLDGQPLKGNLSSFGGGEDEEEESLNPLLPIHSDG